MLPSRLPRGWAPWGVRRWLGGLDWRCRARAQREGQQQWLAAAQIIPVPGCGITWHVPDRRRSSLGGLVQEQRKLHPLPGVLLCRALHSLQNGKHVSVRHEERGTLCLCCAVHSRFGEADVTAAARKRQLCPPRRKGIPEASPSSCRGSRCHVLWHHETSVLWISCCSEAGIPGCQGGFRPDPVLLHSNGILH